MKRMFAGLFLAASAAPMAFLVGGFAFRHVFGTGLHGAIDVAANTAMCMLGLGLFVFMSGLAAKPATASKAPAVGTCNE